MGDIQDPVLRYNYHYCHQRHLATTTNINKQQAGHLTANLPGQALNIQLESCQLESVSDIHEHVTLCDSVTMHQICGMIQTKY